ncbi:MAG: PA14 domain-containing protein, partial [Cyclobacteriaceae bacterium]
MKKLICVIALLFTVQGLVFAQAGGQRAVPKGTTSLNYGFYEYLPEDYNPSSGKKYPVMIFLHGLGERGNGTTDLKKVTYNGPPKLAQQGRDFPFIVISPQLPNTQGGWWGGITDEVVNYVFAKYPVDRTRVYVSGLSLGGNGTYIYASQFPEKVTATVPIAAWGPTGDACKMKDIPTWAFHGDKDWTINITRGEAMINAIKNCGGTTRWTVYPGVGHNSWSRTYDKSAGHDIYSWLMQFSKGSGPSAPVNYPPNVNAGADKSLQLPANSVTLYGNASDNDGTVTSFKWTKVNGPSANLSGAGSKNLTVSNLQAGTYTFQLKATDNDGASATDKVIVNVTDEPSYTPPSSGSGLAYKYYEGIWDYIPSTAGLTAKKTGEVNNVTMAMRNRDNAFLLTFDGAINIPAAGNYTFYVNSDDASNLYIDGKRVVDNDGRHAPRERNGQVYLSAGEHQFALHYYEHYGSEILEARWSGPGISKQLIPDSAFGGSSSSDPAPPSDPDPAPAPGNGSELTYKVYKGNWQWLPNFGALTPIKSGTASNFDISLAGLDTNFGIDFNGSINIPTAGTYKFYTASDDGSKLYIDGKAVVNNDGLHAEQERSGSVYLTAGSHDIRVSFFEQYGGEVLKVKWSGPGISKQAIPNSALGSSSGNSAPEPAPSEPAATGKKLQLNFNHYQPATSNGWNSLSGDPRSDLSYNGFKWNDGASSNVRVTLADSWGGANEYGMVTGDNS